MGLFHKFLRGLQNYTARNTWCKLTRGLLWGSAPPLNEDCDCRQLSQRGGNSVVRLRDNALCCISSAVIVNRATDIRERNPYPYARSHPHFQQSG